MCVVCVCVKMDCVVHVVKQVVLGVHSVHVLGTKLRQASGVEGNCVCVCVFVCERERESTCMCVCVCVYICVINWHNLYEPFFPLPTHSNFRNFHNY